MFQELIAPVDHTNRFDIENALASHRGVKATPFSGLDSMWPPSRCLGLTVRSISMLQSHELSSVNFSRRKNAAEGNFAHFDMLLVQTISSVAIG